MAGAEVDVDRLTWRPVRRRSPVLRDLSLHIPPGQRVLVAGASGAGKSTLLRALGGLLRTADAGDLTGTVRVGGEPPTAQSGRVGLLLQDPLAGLVAETVGRDVAFGPENARLRRPEIWSRVHAALEQSDFPYPVEHPTAALSGGETQRLALAGNLALRSDVVLLDEPTSMLDPPSAASLRAAIRAHVEQTGTTTVVVEHRIEPWLDFADRLLVLGTYGEILADGKPAEVLDEQGHFLAELGVWVPDVPPPTIEPLDADLVAPLMHLDGDLVRASGVGVEMRNRLTRRRVAPTVALDGVDASLTAGQTLAVTGHSGAGKSTLVGLLAGLLSPTTGSVTAAEPLRVKGESRPSRWKSRALTQRLTWVPQTPEHGIVARTVRDELLAAGRASGVDAQTLNRRADGLLDAFGLAELAQSSPYHLSGGEQRRLIVAAALTHGPAGLLLDEPTVGQDRQTWAAVVSAVHAARTAGSGVAVSTHDRLAVDALADTTLELANGKVLR